MIVKEIVSVIENVAPLALQESYDNAGLIVGDENATVTGVLLCLDITEEVVNEAISKKCNLIIAHHPIVFKGLKKFNGKNYVERVIIKAIKNDVHLYAAHTNLDNVLEHGVNQKIAQKLKLTDCSILAPLQDNLLQLNTYCPPAYAEMLRKALWEAGAGHIGDYANCSFTLAGTGSFMPIGEANPVIGKLDELEFVEEVKLSFVLPKELYSKVLNALKESHPYEEVAYEMLTLANTNQTKGAGMLGILPQPMQITAFLSYLKQQMRLEMIRFTPLSVDKDIETVAICGGSGRFLLEKAIAAGADAFVSADFKYHDFFEANNKLVICDIGHYESEIYTLEIFMELLKEKFPTFAVLYSAISTNPVKYHI